MKPPTDQNYRRGARPTVIAWLLCGACVAAHAWTDSSAVPPRFTRYDIASGLSQSSVTAITSDRFGFLWVGTFDGLNRFDGYEFRHFRADTENPYALDDASVTALAAHPDGSVWVGTTNGGVARFDARQEVFAVGRAGAPFAAIPADRVNAIAIGPEGTVWVGTPAGLARAAAPDSTTLRFKLVTAASITSLETDADARAWAGQADGTVEIFGANGTKEFSLPAASLFGPGKVIRAIAADPQGSMWIAGSGADVICVSRDGRILTRQSAVSGRNPLELQIRALEVAADGRLWIGGLGVALVMFDPRENRWRRAHHQEFDPYSVSQDDVVALYQSSPDLLWIGTLGGGLNRLRVHPSGFEHHRHDPDRPGSLSHNNVTAFAAERHGRIWVGTDGGGLNLFDPASSQFSRQPLTRSGAGTGGHQRVWSLLVDRSDALWAGTWGAGLHVRRGPASPFERVGDLPGAIVLSLLEDPEGLWAGTADAGLSLLSPRGSLLRRHLEHENIVALARGANGLIWAGSWSNGLYRIDPGRDEPRHFVNVPGNPSSLPHNAVRSLLVDRAGTLWLATGAGIARHDAATGTFTRFGTANGLPAGMMYGMQFDARQQLWLSSNAGLARFDIATASARIYGPEDGVQDFEFNGGAHLRLPDGRLLYGGIHGFNLFDPLAVAPLPPPRPPLIVGVRILNQPAQPRIHDPRSPLEVSAVELDALTVTRREHTVAFQFASPLPVTPSQLRYSYRLEGFDDAWRTTSARDRQAVYTNLSPGRYRFRVRVANPDGDWSPQDRSVSLRVDPPWWASGWAYAFYLASALLLTLLTLRWRTYALRARARILQKRVDERTAQLARQNQLIENQAVQLRTALEAKEKLFARVSHEFRTPLTLILGPLDALLAEERRGGIVSWLKLMRRSALRLLSLVDQLLGLARLSGEAPLVLAPQSIRRAVQGVVAAFNAVAATRQLRLSIERLDDAWVAATPELIERVVTNLVSNALKYTPHGGHVRIHAQDTGAAVLISVTDDGPGISLEEQERIFEPFQRLNSDSGGSGIGLALVRETVQALGGSVTVQSSPGLGATFLVRLPVCDPPTQDPEAAPQAAPSERVLLECAVAMTLTPAQSETAAASPAAPETDDRPRVHAIEDNADLREMLRVVLSRRFRCATFDNGATGLAAAQEDPPDLIVSDVMMPGLDGFELTRALKHDERTSHVPVILLTALGDRDNRLRGLEDQADDYFVKPFDPDELLLRVRNLIESRQILSRRARLAAHPPDPAAAPPDAAPVHGPRERAFLDRLQSAALAGHASSAFGVAELARATAMSERQLQRKLRALLDLAPADYLREVRLQRAAGLLRAGEPVGNVALDCGFSSHSYFSACFKARFGVTPGEFAGGA